MSEKDKINRRNVLKSTGAFSALSTMGFVGSVSALEDESDIDIESLVASEKVQTIIESIPDLELNTDEAIGIKSNPPSILIPTNKGKLIVSGTEDDRTVLFYFDKWIPNFESDWPEGTDARLVLKEEGEGDIIFQRTATEEETQKYLNSITDPEIDNQEDAYVSVTPEKNEFDITHFDNNNKVVNIIRGEEKDNKNEERQTINTHDSGLEIEITTRESYGSGKDEGQIRPMIGCGECGDSIAADVLYCLQQVSNCGACTIGSPIPPAAVACWLIVCIGVNSADAVTLFLEDVNIPGCVNLAQCAGDCFAEQWSDLW